MHTGLERYIRWNKLILLLESDDWEDEGRDGILREVVIFVPQQSRKDFSHSLCVQTGSGAHPASCPMGTGGPFPGSKARPGRDANHSPPPSAEVENE
jgi:hypothetical protein